MVIRPSTKNRSRKNGLMVFWYPPTAAVLVVPSLAGSPSHGRQ